MYHWVVRITYPFALAHVLKRAQRLYRLPNVRATVEPLSVTDSCEDTARTLHLPLVRICPHAGEHQTRRAWMLWCVRTILQVMKAEVVDAVNFVLVLRNSGEGRPGATAIETGDVESREGEILCLVVEIYWVPVKPDVPIDSLANKRVIELDVFLDLCVWLCSKSGKNQIRNIVTKETVLR